MIERTGQGNEIERLRWQCRRGMLELDVALTRFLESEYEGSDEARRAAFARLLQIQDPILYEWLMGRSVPTDPDMERLIAVIRGGGRTVG